MTRAARRRAIPAAAVVGMLAACGRETAPTLSGPFVHLWLEADSAVVEGDKDLFGPDLVATGEGVDAPALRLHPPAAARFRVALEQSPRLRASLLRPRSFVEQGSDGVELSVSVRASGGGAEVRRDVWLAPAGPDREELDLDLTPLAGRLVDVELRAGAGKAGDLRHDTAFVVAPRISQRMATVGAEPPRTLLVTIDTLRQDHLSCYGDPRGLTPHVDRLSRSGILAASAYAQSNATTPSHGVIMTGRTPGESGVYGSETPLPEGVPTLAEAFHERGARTVALPSVAHLMPQMSGLGRGFDRVVATRSTRRGPDTTDLALGVLSRHRGESLFLWIHYFDPHTPYEDRAPWSGLRDAEAEATDPALAMTVAEAARGGHLPVQWTRWLEGSADARLPAARYASEVAATDHEVGRLLAALQGARAGSPATVALTADHGEALAEHGVYFDHVGLYEPSVAVPLIVRAPGAAPVVREGPAAHVDLFPTLTGRAVSRTLPARSLLEPAAGGAERTLFFWHAHRESAGALRASRKVILPVEPRLDVNLAPRVFDLDADPREESGAAPTADDELARAIEETARRDRPAEVRTMSDEQADQLESLGYLTRRKAKGSAP